MSEVKAEITFDAERFQKDLIKLAARIGFDTALTEMMDRIRDYMWCGDILDVEFLSEREETYR